MQVQSHRIPHISHPLPQEICAQCGHPIGKRETPRIWRDTVVCPLCHEMLQDQQLIFRAFGKAVSGSPVSPRA
jgi:hypothetical protein